MTGPTRRSLLAGLGAGLLAPGLLQSRPAGADRGPPPLSGEFQEHFIVQAPPVPAPRAYFAGAEGQELALTDFLGRTVLLNLWATWCAPCVEEMPALDRLEATLGGAGFHVIAVSQDRGGPGAVVPFFAQQQLRTLVPYTDPKGTVGNAFRARGLPTSYLIDPMGFVVGILEGAADWDSEDALALIRHYLPEV